MKKNPQHTTKNYLLSYLLVLTVFFIGLEVSAFIQSSDIYLGDYKLVAEHLNIPANVVPGILYFVLVQLFLHGCFVFVTWLMAKGIGAIFSCSVSRTETLGICLWFAGILLILLANQYYFPNSKFAQLSSFIFPTAILLILLRIMLGVWISAFIVALIGMLLQFPRRVGLSLGIAGVLSLVVSYWPTSPILDGATATKPNIILIGVDSLRPDFLGYYGSVKQTPHLDEFLTHSTVFAEALTPLARTFPAWVSILSGKYPKHTGVRFNLPTVNNARWDNTLPAILKSKGYQTIFSTDETRFSNIDQQYGFDQTLTPPMGFNDFLLGNLNDFPLANLAVNTKIGKYLFPHSYANRPVFITYNPDTFLEYIQPTLMKSRQQPLFLAIHFCLPHFPYFWGKHSAEDKSINNYYASIKRVDKQFNDFLELLKKSQLLNHAIVVILSDHGEAIELPGDRVTEAALFVPGADNTNKTLPHFYPPSFDFETINQSAGHGTDVLGLSQYHIVLAFRTFGVEANQAGDRLERVSLLDIKPTILDFLNMKEASAYDGHSLKSFILGREERALPDQHFFYESDFSPQAVRSVHPETRKLLFAGIDYFQIDPSNGRIQVKKSMEKLILSSKQFADSYKEWVLALYPQNQQQMMPILVNLRTGVWTNDLRNSFAKKSPAKKMLISLKKFFGEDITQVMNSEN